MNITTFNNKNNGINSIRVGNKNFRMNTILGTSRGGTTFHSKYGSVRVSNFGGITGIGIRTGRRTSYLGSNMKIKSHLEGF